MLARSLKAELGHEAGVTRRLLERAPGDRLGWKPHERSMTLGRLTGHIAELAMWGASTVANPEVDLAAHPELRPGIAESVDGLLETFDRNVEAFQAALDDCPDDAMFQTWRLRNGDHVILEMPRVAALRGFVLSHMIHHRGQLSVYLRLLDVPLPQVYGPTADDPSGMGR